MTVDVQDLASLAGAVMLAAIGGEAFLKGVLGFAAWIRIPKLLAATTISAFATSGPELTVATVSAWAGMPEIALGDALGSNVANVGLIFGLGLLLGSISVPRADLKRDYPFALMVPLATLALAADGELTRMDGALLLAVFACWTVLSIRAGINSRACSTGVKTVAPVPVFAAGLAGLAMLLLAGRLFVSGATGVASALGISQYVAGSLIIAVGTSTPELVTVVIAKLRGHDEIGIGTVLGSNVFNGLFVVGIAACIHPIGSNVGELLPAILAGAFAVLLTIPGKPARIGRLRAIGLLGCYAAFVAASLA